MPCHSHWAPNHLNESQNDIHSNPYICTPSYSICEQLHPCMPKKNPKKCVFFPLCLLFILSFVLCVCIFFLLSAQFICFRYCARAQANTAHMNENMHIHIHTLRGHIYIYICVYILEVCDALLRLL